MKRAFRKQKERNKNSFIFIFYDFEVPVVVDGYSFSPFVYADLTHIVAAALPHCSSIAIIIFLLLYTFLWHFLSADCENEQKKVGYVHFILWQYNAYISLTLKCAIVCCEIYQNL